MCAHNPQVTAKAAQSPLQGNSKESKNPFNEDYGKRVDQLLEKWHVPGLAIGVVDGDDIWTEGYGIATYPSTPVTPSTLFYCASTTKAFTAAIFALMIESGKYTVPAHPGKRLDWDTSLHDIIPEDFVLMDEWATTHITIEDALSHRSGLPRHDKASTHRVAVTGDEAGDGKDDNNKRTASVRDQVRALRYLPLSEPPRTKLQYCNQMYIAASHAIETLNGGRFLGDLLREWIWEPLGMGSSYFRREDGFAAPEHLADGYGWEIRYQSEGEDNDGKGGDSGEFVRVPHMALEEDSGAGSTISNVQDYTKWVRSLLREEGPISKANHEILKTPRMIMSPKGALTSSKKPYDSAEMYALGWIVASYRGHKFWTHSGGMNAFGTEVFFFPDLDFGVVTMGNTAGTSNYIARILIWGLVDDKLGVPEDQRHDWASDFEDYEKKQSAKYDKAIDNYYPNRPAHSVPPSLPLEAYTGTYFHPGYLDFTLELADTASTTRSNITLTSTRADATWPTFNQFEHVTGEYWMLYFHLLTNPQQGPFKEYSPAQFRIGADGKVETLGITWLSTSGDEDLVEGLVWFDKVV